MRLLTFNVDAQQIEKDPDCDFQHIVAGSRNYLKAYFNLPDEWTGCAVAASFWRGKEEHAVLLKDNACTIPSEVLDGLSFRVSVTCQKGGLRIPTNKTVVRQEVSR